MEYGLFKKILHLNTPLEVHLEMLLAESSSQASSHEP